jgi:hypothetical protein
MATLSDIAGISTRRLDADRAEVFAALGDVERRFGRIDGLSARQRSNRARPFTRWAGAGSASADELDGVVWCHQAVVAGMIARRRGSIIAFTSGLAHQGWPGVGLRREQGGADRVREERGQGDRAASRALQSHRARRDRHPAVSQRQCRRRRRAGAHRSGSGSRRMWSAAAVPVRPGDDDRFDHQPGFAYAAQETEG